MSYAGSSHSGSSSSSQNYDIPHQVILVNTNQTIIKKEPQSKTSPKSSPKSRTPRNKQITDLVLTDEEKRLLIKEGI